MTEKQRLRMIKTLKPTADMKSQATKPKVNQVITVKTDAENPEPMEVIAKAIVEVANYLDKINSTPLRRRAITLLIKDATGVGLNEINAVLDCAPLLRRHFLKS